VTERCGISGLPVEWCACRIHGPKEEPDSWRKAFSARYPGHCRECREPIEVGDIITTPEGGSGSGGYIHERCS
jgi:hypothetical protein